MSASSIFLQYEFMRSWNLLKSEREFFTSSLKSGSIKAPWSSGAQENGRVDGSLGRIFKKDQEILIEKGYFYCIFLYDEYLSYPGAMGV